MSSDIKKKLPKNDLLSQLISRQRADVPDQFRLKCSDMKRICKYITESIFEEDHCSLWNGYITNCNNDSKGTYVNFYFKGKKMALHRLLYNNFIEPLKDDEYLKFTCGNKGSCCCIHHLRKFTYKKKSSTNSIVKKSRKMIHTDIIRNSSVTDLTINFGW